MMVLKQNTGILYASIFEQSSNIPLGAFVEIRFKKTDFIKFYISSIILYF